MKRIGCVFLCVILCIGLCSCSGKDALRIQNTYSLTLELPDYVVFQRYTKYPFLYDKQTESYERFFYDPISELDGSSRFLRYTHSGGNTVSMTNGQSIYDIYQVDLDTFYWNDDQGIHNGVYASYLGAEDLFPDLTYSLAKEQMVSVLCGLFSYSGDFIMVRTSGIFLLQSGRKSAEECIYEDENISQNNVAFDGRAVYYLTESRELVKVELNTAKRTVLREGVTDFRLTDRGALLLCDRELLLLDLNSGKEKILVSGAGAVLGGTDDYAYYCDTTGDSGNEGRLYRIPWDGSAAEVLPVEGYFHTLGIVSDHQWLFFYGKDGLSRCNYDGTNVVLVESNA